MHGRSASLVCADADATVTSARQGDLLMTVLSFISDVVVVFLRTPHHQVLLTNPLWVVNTEIKTRKPAKDGGAANNNNNNKGM